MAKPEGAAKVNVRLPVPSCRTIIVKARTLPEDISSVFGSVSVVLPVSVKSMLLISLLTAMDPVAEVLAVMLSWNEDSSTFVSLPLAKLSASSVS